MTRNYVLGFLSVATATGVALQPVSALAAKQKKQKPQAEAQTDEQIARDIRVPAGFDMTIFAKPPMANYPVFVAAAPDGTLYVSSDGNGSLDRNPHRGRILRLRDTDGDGEADEMKEFVKDVDAPRGIVWDHDRIYVIHPPNLSVFIDTDGDGVADKEVVLVKNCGFTFKDRPADHTTNGLEMGPDGWLYVSQGDFGFMEAEGTDGRKMQCRGGGIWRVRPDGTGMEMYAYGSRNIVEAGVSPLLDLFARDNTNDGGGWDVRYHHFTGLEDHGYPRLYANFADEIMPRLADYGGGGPCGSAYIEEPGLPAGYSPAHFSVDWGRGEIYRHPAKIKGATFEVGQESFIKMTRPTDLDVDGNSHLYIASWKGATFTWAGPDVGYIIRLSPQGYTPEPLPNFEKAGDAELVKLLLSPSAVRRMEAQHTLLRRGLKADVARVLAALANDPSKPLASRVIALFTIKQGLGANATPTIVSLTKEPGIRAWAIRALTDRWDQLAGVPSEPILAGLKDADPRVRRESIVAVERLGKKENAAAVAPLLGDDDVVISHTAYRVLMMMNAHDEAFSVVDSTSTSPNARANALRALMRMHDPAVVDGVIARLGKETNLERRKGLITALCRLDQHEGVWKGDSWGTRPDHRGPYYQPEPWAETPKIEKFLSEVLAKAQGDESAYLLAEFARQRINPGDASAKMIEMAMKNDSLIPTAVTQLANSQNPPPPVAVPMLIKALNGSSDKARAEAVAVLARTESAEAFSAMIAAMPQVSESKGLGKEVENARNGLLNAPKMDQHVELFEKLAATLDGKSSVWAEALLVKIASRKIGSPEPREVAQKALTAAWADPKRRVQIMKACGLDRTHYDDAKFVAAMNDSDAAVAKAAKDIVNTLKIDIDKVKSSAGAKANTIATMAVPDVVAAVMKTKGDASRGPQLIKDLGCVSCHTTKKEEPLKGPFLGLVANVYRRGELAENILLPNKTIAMGFGTQIITLRNGKVEAGFVVQEASDVLAIRNAAAQEIKIPVADIAKREKLEISIMPPGLLANSTIEDFASLLDYLEQLAKQ